MTKELDPTNKKILQLESQLIALRDDRNRYRRQYEAAQRSNSIFQALADEMNQIVKPIKPLPRCPKTKYVGKRIKESLVMHLSDEHADEVILPHQVAGLERYDFRIALRRAEVYVNSVIKFTTAVLNNYDFHTLYILANGDHVSGEIHGAVDHSYYRNMFRNCLSVGQMHALMFRDLASVFPRIIVVYTPGNHGRRTIKKDHNDPTNNWDYLVGQIAKSHCKDINNIEFLIPDSYSVNLQIEGHGFHVVHGEDIRSWNSIPWYGIERKTRRLIALNSILDQEINYFAFAHFHTPASQSFLRGKTIINGTWTGTTPFVFNQLSSYIEPTQVIHGVHRDHGVSWQLDVRLKSENEHLGPTRYASLLKEK